MSDGKFRETTNEYMYIRTIHWNVLSVFRTGRLEQMKLEWNGDADVYTILEYQ
jgi:hypothetical protein